MPPTHGRRDDTHGTENGECGDEALAAGYAGHIEVGEAAVPSGKAVKIGRDARTGKFITVQKAIKRPDTTVVETIRRPAKPKAK